MDIHQFMIVFVINGMLTELILLLITRCELALLRQGGRRRQFET